MSDASVLHRVNLRRAIEFLRFTSGDEDMRASLYGEFGDGLFSNLRLVADAVENRLAEWQRDKLTMTMTMTMTMTTNGPASKGACLKKSE